MGRQQMFAEEEEINDAHRDDDQSYGGDFKQAERLHVLRADVAANGDVGGRADQSASAPEDRSVGQWEKNLRWADFDFLGHADRWTDEQSGDRGIVHESRETTGHSH